jgi:hypothetical protein
MTGISAAAAEAAGSLVVESRMWPVIDRIRFEDSISELADGRMPPTARFVIF